MLDRSAAETALDDGLRNFGLAALAFFAFFGLKDCAFVATGIGNEHVRGVGQARLEEWIDHGADGAFFRKFRAAFPDDYKRFAAGFDAKYADGASDHDLQVYVGESMNSFVMSRRKLIARARADELLALGQASHRAVAALGRQSTPLCASFILDGDIDEEGIRNLAPATREATMASAERVIDAIVSGRTHKLHWPAPTRSDFDSLGVRMRSVGAATGDLDQFFSRERARMSNDALCVTGQAYLQAVLLMEREQAVRFLAAEFSR